MSHETEHEHRPPSIEEILARWAEVRALIVADDEEVEPTRWKQIHTEVLAADYPVLIFYLTYRKDLMDALDDLSRTSRLMMNQYLGIVEVVRDLGDQVDEIADRLASMPPTDDQLRRFGFGPDRPAS